MKFTKTILDEIVKEAVLIFPGKNLLQKLIKTELNERTYEMITADFQTVVLEIKMGFHNCIERINFSGIISGFAEVINGNWYSSDSIIMRQNIQLNNSPSTICYEERKNGNLTKIILSDSKRNTYTLNVENDISFALH